MDFERKYKKYKSKYLLEKAQRGSGIGFTRQLYEESVYIVSYEFAYDIYKKHRDVIDQIYSRACIVIINFLLKNKDFATGFDKRYNDKATGGVYVTTVLNPSDYATYKNISNNSNMLQWVKNYMTSIRIKCMFTFIFMEYIRQESYFLSNFDSYLAQCIMARGMKPSGADVYGDESKNKYLCISDFCSGQLPYNPKNCTNTKEINRQTTHCIPMLQPFEPYSSFEQNSRSTENNIMYDTGADVFRKPTNENENSIDVYRAGTSGNTINVCLLFLLLMDNNNDLDNRQIFMAVMLGVMINMIQYYHHSLREFFIVYTGLFNDTDFYNLVIKLYANGDDMTIFGTLADIRSYIDKMFANGLVIPVMTDRYLTEVIKNKKIGENPMTNINRADYLQGFSSEDVKSRLNKITKKYENLRKIIKNSNLIDYNIDYSRSTIYGKLGKCDEVAII